MTCSVQTYRVLNRCDPSSVDLHWLWLGIFEKWSAQAVRLAMPKALHLFNVLPRVRESGSDPDRRLQGRFVYERDPTGWNRKNAPIASGASRRRIFPSAVQSRDTEKGKPMSIDVAISSTAFRAIGVEPLTVILLARGRSVRGTKVPVGTVIIKSPTSIPNGQRVYNELTKPLSWVVAVARGEKNLVDILCECGQAERESLNKYELPMHLMASYICKHRTNPAQIKLQAVAESPCFSCVYRMVLVRRRCAIGWSGVVVAQGPVSGWPITSRLATEFGREVYGVPGNVTEPVSFAPNRLIKQGGEAGGVLGRRS